MALLVQPLTSAQPLRPVRWHLATCSNQCAHLHIRCALARPEPKTLGLGLARRAVHFAGGRGKEDAPAIVGTFLRAAL